MKTNKHLEYFIIGFIDGFSGYYKFSSFSIKAPVVDYNKSNIELDWKNVGETMIYAAKRLKENNAI